MTNCKSAGAYIAQLKEYRGYDHCANKPPDAILNFAVNSLMLRHFRHWPTFNRHRRPADVSLDGILGVAGGTSPSGDLNLVAEHVLATTAKAPPTRTKEASQER
jgi:hypothetical protein